MIGQISVFKYKANDLGKLNRNISQNLGNIYRYSLDISRNIYILRVNETLHIFTENIQKYTYFLIIHIHCNRNMLKFTSNDGESLPFWKRCTEVYCHLRLLHYDRVYELI